MQTPQYAWLEWFVSFKREQQIDQESDTKDPGAELSNITARLGQFQLSTTRSANDSKIAAALFALVLIWVWNVAKYRANLRVFDKNGVKKCQTQTGAFSTPGFLESLAIQWLHETEQLFLEADSPCQMNSSPTQRAMN